MREIAGIEALSFLKENSKIEWENSKIFDMFARDGSWISKIFYEGLSHKKYLASEIDSKFWPDLIKNLPNCLISNDCYSEIGVGESPDFVFIDNPMGTHNNDRCCEHFSIFDDSSFWNWMKKKENFAISFNVKVDPNPVTPLWKNFRRSFYRADKQDFLFMIDFYQTILPQLSGREISYFQISERPQEPGLYLFTVIFND